MCQSKKDDWMHIIHFVMNRVYLMDQYNPLCVQI